jgi:hypothetical protein
MRHSLWRLVVGTGAILCPLWERTASLPPAIKIGLSRYLLRCLNEEAHRVQEECKTEAKGVRNGYRKVHDLDFDQNHKKTVVIRQFANLEDRAITFRLENSIKFDAVGHVLRREDAEDMSPLFLKSKKARGSTDQGEVKQAKGGLASLVTVTLHT